MFSYMSADKTETVLRDTVLNKADGTTTSLVIKDNSSSLKKVLFFLQHISAESDSAVAVDPFSS